jgi:hypothetical protein
MNLILHHLRKDIRAQRLLLFLWALVLALKIGVNLLILQPDYHLAGAANFLRASAVLSLTSLVLLAVITVRLIQSEPVTGTTSFWLTRPIPRGAYLPSKLIFIFVLLLVPVVIPPVIDMALYRVDATHVLHAMRGLAAWYAIVTILVLWLATYTRTMSEFWVVAIAAVLATIALVAGFTFARFSIGSNLENVEITMSRTAMFVIVLLGGLLISLLIQHAWRKIEGGFAVGIGSVIVAVLILLFWPFALPAQFAASIVGVIATTDFESESFTSNETPSVFSDNWDDAVEWSHDPSNNGWRVSAHFTPAAGHGSRVPLVEGIGASFSSGPGQSIGLPNRGESFSDDIEPVDYQAAVANDLPGIQLASVPHSQPFDFHYELFELDPDTLAKVRGQVGQLHLSIFGHFAGLVRKAAVPLGHDAVALAPGEVIHVARLPQAPDTMINPLAPPPHQPVLAVWTLSYRHPAYMRQPGLYYVLVDPVAKTGTFLFTNHSEMTVGLTNSPFNKSDRRIFLPLQGDEPLDRMLLYIYEAERNTPFSTDLTAPHFHMSPPAP